MFFYVFLKFHGQRRALQLINNNYLWFQDDLETFNMDTGGGQMGNMDLNKVIGRSNLAKQGNWEVRLS